MMAPVSSSAEVCILIYGENILLLESPRGAEKPRQRVGIADWKVLQYGKFPNSLESFWTVRKDSRQSGKCPDSLECFRIVLYFLYSLQIVLNDLRTFAYVVKTIYALLTHLS